MQNGGIMQNSVGGYGRHDVVADNSAYMQKRGGQLAEELDFILKGIKENGISMSEGVRASAIGALAAALAGGGIGAAVGARKNKKGKRRIGKGALIGALLGLGTGAVAGPAYAQLRKYLDGVPFNNDKFDKSEHKPGSKVYIGVAGSANGENESWFADEMRSRFGKDAYMLRHVDGKKLKQKYDELTGKGLDVTVVGHSSGGATAGRFLRENPDAHGYLIDPVSWLGRGSSDNAVVFTADESTRHGGPFENTIADLGGRWNENGKNAVKFKGSHSNRIFSILRDFVAREVRNKEQLGSRPDYVTSAFGG